MALDMRKIHNFARFIENPRKITSKTSDRKMKALLGDTFHPLVAKGSCRAFYTSRGDACSPSDPYGGFSVCHYTGDLQVHTQACLSTLYEFIKSPIERIIIPTQTHSCNVEIIDTLPFPESRLEGCDALVTNIRGVVLAINTADCVPVVLIDPVNNIIGVAHAGWRGAIGGIVERTVDAMQRLGASPYEMNYALGPSICVECFEVGHEVADRFPAEVVSHPNNSIRPHIDLQKFIRLRLADYGITKEAGQPWDNSICTRHNPEKFFSARALGTSSGRGLTFVFII